MKDARKSLKVESKAAKRRAQRHAGGQLAEYTRELSMHARRARQPRARLSMGAPS